MTLLATFKRNEQGEIELVKQTLLKCLKKNALNAANHWPLVGKFGPFIACTGYPECKYVHHVKAGLNAPLMEGELFLRRWRGGTFWGCGNYPKCRFAVFGDFEELPVHNANYRF